MTTSHSSNQSSHRRPSEGGESARGGHSRGRSSFASSPSSSQGDRPVRRFSRGPSSSQDSQGSSQGGFRGGSHSRGRSSFGGSSSRDGFRGGSRGGFSGGFRSGGSRGGSRGGKRFQGQQIDISRFVNKAVITEEASVFVPEHAFIDFKIDDRLKANIVRKGYVTPSPIQDKAIPHVHRGEDVVGIANTGTGKTAAFLIPLIDRVLTKNERVLVVAPTRELAAQIENELRDFVPGLRIGSTCCVGGAPMGRQIGDLRRNPAFVVGTPGRLKDLMQQKVLDLSSFNVIVLDEADRMLDMGFIADMRFMMSHMPKDRQTLLFTATMSREIEHLIGDFLNQPVRISVKTSETSKSVDQDIIRVARGENKIDILAKLLKDTEEFKKVLVFVRTKHGTQRLSSDLNQMGFRTDAIHGDKSYSQRMRALEAFKGHRVQVLVATDVAARGLDVTGVSHVINYDLPATYEDYVHRIGRTGRGDRTGKAITFVE